MAVVVAAPLAACAPAARHASVAAPAPGPALVIEAPAVAPLAGSTIRLAASVGAAPADRVHWSAARYDRAWVAPNGVLTLLEPGLVTVEATDGARRAERAIEVRANPAARVVMEAPVLPAATVGDTVRIRAWVYDRDGSRVPDAPVAYALVARGLRPGAALVTEDGRFVATEPGVYTVVAECGRVSARTIVIVEGEEERALRALRTVPVAAPVAPAAERDTGSLARSGATLGAVRVEARRTRKVEIDDVDAQPYEGTTLTLAARVWTVGEKAPDTTAQVVWTSSDPTMAYVNQRGQVVFLRAGWVKIVAAHAGKIDERRFEVRWHPAARLALRSNRVDARVGEPVTFREDVWQAGGIPVRDARVNYAVIANGESERPVDASVTEERVFVATRPGVYTVLAEVGGVADKFTMFVAPPLPKPAARATVRTAQARPGATGSR